MTRLVREADLQRGNGHSWGLLREFAASGISVGCANTVLNPVEVIKTRMQLNGAAIKSATGPSQHAAAAAISAHATAGTGSLAATTAAAAASSGGSSSSGSFLTNASAARFFSHTASYRGVTQGSAGNAAATAAAAAAAQPQVLLFPPPPPVLHRSGAAATAAAAPTAERALAVSLDSAAAAISSSSSSSTAAAAAVTQQSLGQSCTVRRPGFLATAGIIMQQEGPTAFTRGIQASATRAVLNGGIRLGLYDPIKTLLSSDGTGRDLHMGQKLAAGSISGGIGAVLTTPIELAKTRLQAASAQTRSMSEVLRGVVAQQGVAGLWRGATPSVLRLILLNGSMVATYDEVKGHIRSLTGWNSGLQLVLSSSMVAGVVTTTVINPADVARAYMQTGRGNSFLGVARAILRTEGPSGFFKGWTAAYARTGPQTLIIFSVSEIVRPLFGLKVIGGSG